MGGPGDQAPGTGSNLSETREDIKRRVIENHQGILLKVGTIKYQLQRGEKIDLQQLKEIEDETVESWQLVKKL